MGFFIQLIGIIIAFASLIIGVVVIKTGTKSSVPVILLIFAIMLISVGRRINK